MNKILDEYKKNPQIFSDLELITQTKVVNTEKNTEVSHISLKYVIPRNKLVYFLKEKNLKHD